MAANHISAKPGTLLQLKRALPIAILMLATLGRAAKAENYERYINDLAYGTPPARVEAGYQALLKAEAEAFPTLAKHMDDRRRADNRFHGSVTTNPTIGQACFSIVYKVLDLRRAKTERSLVPNGENFAQWWDQHKNLSLEDLRVVAAKEDEQQRQARASTTTDTTKLTTDKGFYQAESMNGPAVRIQCANKGSLNELIITPFAFDKDNMIIRRQIPGKVIKVETGDINVDTFPEVYIVIHSAGSGSYGSVVAYSSNKGKSLSEIAFPELTTGSRELKGYMGHDEFAVVETTFCRRFPLYEAGDTNSKPTGKMRQLQYKLKAGEAGWALRLDRVTEF